MNDFSSVDLMRYRQVELTHVAQLLTKEAQRIARLATIIKISLILLGALVVVDGQ